MEAASLATREQAPLEDASLAAPAAAEIAVQRDAGWSVPLLIFASTTVVIYIGMGYAVYLLVAAVA
jgi:hypothetical protein